MPKSPDLEVQKRRRENYGFHLEYRTRWQDNDMYGHMNNGVYYYLFDSIINAYLIQRCGFDPRTSQSIGLVVHSQCNYFGSVTFPAVLDLGLRVSTLGNASATYEVGVFERGKEDVRAVGGYTHVFVDRDKKRPALDANPKFDILGFSFPVFNKCKTLKQIRMNLAPSIHQVVHPERLSRSNWLE